MEKADGGQRAFGLGPTAIEEMSERTREVGTAKEPTPDREWAADRECAATATEKDEIRELKALVGKLLTQVQSAGIIMMLAQMVAGWRTYGGLLPPQR